MVITVTMISKCRTCAKMVTARMPPRYADLLRELIGKGSSAIHTSTCSLLLDLYGSSSFAIHKRVHFSSVASLYEPDVGDMPPKRSDLSRTDIRKMKVAEIRRELNIRRLDTAGKKEDLSERLCKALGLPEKTRKLSAISREGGNTALGQNVSDTVGETKLLNPDLTYVIRIKNAASGRMQCVTGIGLGMTLRVHDGEHSNKDQTIFDTNKLLLPGARKPFDAHYCALIMSMKYAKSRGIQNIIMEIDDMGIVKQLTGLGSIGSGENQQKLHKEAMELSSSFQTFEVQHYNGENKCLQTEFLAKTALAEQKPLQSDWEAVDPMTDQPTSAIDRHVRIDPDREYILQFDGGARNNPGGIAGAGMVIYDNDDQRGEVWCGWKYIGKAQTNNVAEYFALIEGLKCAKLLGIRRLHAEGDSMLVVKQILGQYKVKSSWLMPLHQEVHNLISSFESFSIASIPRAQNARADYLANHSMDLRTSRSADELKLN